MSTPSDIAWDTGDKSRMVSIGTHNLYLSPLGPDRKFGASMVMVKRLVTSFARWLKYDRSGLGRSEDPPVTPEEITAVSVATELDILLKTEWAVVEREHNSERTKVTHTAELKGCFKDPPVLAAKKQLENRILANHPVSVLAANTAMDLQRLYDAGVATGDATEEERAQYRSLADRFAGEDIIKQQRQLELSSNGRYIFTTNNTHNVQMTDPKVVVDEIKWGLDHFVVRL
ncbi:hypothetical protein OIDMADRAFT_28339 [Oidiodendron maius Zn]|uniref:Uncharacterized protein n=1 Tax=Oidiodendron maius (strain Zn) TaxID=913774 RepID=A0A0C3H250_OIDMZ|nr:hypothetical protein OIDMADRAFT_28339 [Oidiodendron maius Zn]